MIHRSFPLKICCPLIRQPMCRTGTPPISAINPMVSLAIPMSWTRGPPRHSHHRSPVSGKTMPISSGESSPWIYVPRLTTSFARGCSVPSYAQTLNTIRCRGRTQHCQVGFSTPIAKRCRSQRATLSPPLTCLKNLDRMPCVIGLHQLDPESTLHSAKTR